MTILNSMFKFLNFWLVHILAHQKPIRSRVAGHRIMVSGLAQLYFTEFPSWGLGTGKN